MDDIALEFGLFEPEAMEEFADNIDAYVSSAITSVLEEYGPMIAQRAQSLCPVRTGALQDSITYFIDGEELLVFGLIYYYPFVEYGTYKMTGAHMVSQAFDEYEGEMLDAIDLAIQANVEGEPYSAFGRRPEPYF